MSQLKFDLLIRVLSETQIYIWWLAWFGLTALLVALVIWSRREFLARQYPVTDKDRKVGNYYIGAGAGIVFLSFCLLILLAYL